MIQATYLQCIGTVLKSPYVRYVVYLSIDSIYRLVATGSNIKPYRIEQTAAQLDYLVIEINLVIEIIDFKQTETLLDAHLFDDKNGTKGNVMFVEVMAKDLLQDSPRLQSTVKGFVAGSSSVHGQLVLKAFVMSGRNHFWITLVAGISNDVLTRTQLLLQNGSKDVEIRPCTTFKRATERHNPSSSNADTNLIAQTRPVVLVGVPFALKRKRLQNFKVNSIDGHQSTFIVMVAEPILPLDLLNRRNESKAS